MKFVKLCKKEQNQQKSLRKHSKLRKVRKICTKINKIITKVRVKFTKLRKSVSRNTKFYRNGEKFEEWVKDAFKVKKKLNKKIKNKK